MRLTNSRIRRITVYCVCSLFLSVVGLHPDEATEAIVDWALANGRSFAVVPCCVFARQCGV